MWHEGCYGVDTAAIAGEHAVRYAIARSILADADAAGAWHLPLEGRVVTACDDPRDEPASATCTAACGACRFRGAAWRCDDVALVCL